MYNDGANENHKAGTPGPASIGCHPVIVLVQINLLVLLIVYVHMTTYRSNPRPCVVYSSEVHFPLFFSGHISVTTTHIAAYLQIAKHTGLFDRTASAVVSEFRCCPVPSAGPPRHPFECVGVVGLHAGKGLWSPSSMVLLLPQDGTGVQPPETCSAAHNLIVTLG